MACALQSGVCEEMPHNDTVLEDVATEESRLSFLGVGAQAAGKEVTASGHFAPPRSHTLI